MNNTASILEEDSLIIEDSFGKNKVEDFKTLFDIAPNPIFVTDKNGIYCYVNKSACFFGGYEPDEIIGKNIDEIVQFDNTDNSEKILQKIFEGFEDRREWKFKRKNGDYVWGE